MLKTGAPSPEEVAKQHNLPHLKALIDIDLRHPTKNTIGGDPRNLSRAERSAIKSFGTAKAVITIYSHPGAEEDVARFLEVRPDMLAAIASYGEDYMEDGEMEFAMRQHTDEEVAILLHNALVRRWEQEGRKN